MEKQKERAYWVNYVTPQGTIVVTEASYRLTLEAAKAATESQAQHLSQVFKAR